MDELDPSVKNWRSHVREMAYDIEDCIDDFMHHLEDIDPKEGFINNTVRCLKTVRQRHRIAHQIDKLKTRVLEASKRRKRYNLDYHASTGLVAVDPQVTSLYPKAANLVEDTLQASENIWNIKVDDLWDVQTWNTISRAFPENENGSRIIVTTRVEDVASWACPHHHDCIYRMNPLDSQDSRTLFFNRIYGCEDNCPVQFEKVSAEILKKCRGLPLAIVTIAGLLANQPATLKEWEKTLHSLTMPVGTHPTLEGMRKILNLSYKNLPPHLRTCLLYLGIYPEDYEIKRDDLIRQWVAEGFVCNLHGQELNDVAKSYFNELINRNLILPESTDCGEVLSCRVHDMMLDLIWHRCKDDNFVTVLCNSKDMETHQDNKARRLYLNCSNADLVDGRVSGTILSSMSQVRSFAAYGESKCVPPLVLFKYLWVLILDIFSYEMECKVDLTAISQLFQLKYLKIAGNYIVDVMLPSKIQGLMHLETLDIIYLFSATINVLGELTNLRDLTLCYTDYDDIPDHETAKIKPLVSSEQG
ncbi:hypothetical protein EJB05_27369, partial [Eragrostis curvula]